MTEAKKKLFALSRIHHSNHDIFALLDEETKRELRIKTPHHVGMKRMEMRESATTTLRKSRRTTHRSPYASLRDARHQNIK